MSKKPLKKGVKGKTPGQTDPKLVETKVENFRLKCLTEENTQLRNQNEFLLKQIRDLMSNMDMLRHDHRDVFDVQKREIDQLKRCSEHAQVTLQSELQDLRRALDEKDVEISVQKNRIEQLQEARRMESAKAENTLNSALESMEKHANLLVEKLLVYTRRYDSYVYDTSHRTEHVSHGKSASTISQLEQWITDARNARKPMK